VGEIFSRRISLSSAVGAGLVIAVLLAGFNSCSSRPPLHAWHTEKLNGEFTAEMSGDEVRSFGDYLELEQRLFGELDREVYDRTASGPQQILNRYSPGSAADPRGRDPNWNRSFEMKGDGRGGVLLLHGMSDSPYSLRALGKALNKRGYQVIGLRLPGHGTSPSGLRFVDWRDMAAAAGLAMDRLRDELARTQGRIHIIGYSTGASLALDFTLKAMNDKDLAVPASLILISPAIRVHGTAKLAGFKDGLSIVPGLGGLAWLNVMDEFDPYKYNSFATNAGSQVHRVTVDVDRRIRELSGSAAGSGGFPPVLVFKSTVDSTVTTDAVVDSLLKRLPARRNELVLFDINRQAAIKETLLISDPAPLTNRLMDANDLPFAVTFVTNESSQSNLVVEKYKQSFAAEPAAARELGLAWPRGVVSLSHVALPFPPDDPLYGQFAPPGDDEIFLGDLALRGERGLLKIPGDWLLRMRYNPFYGYVEGRVIDWVNRSGAAASGD
jgi:pimeloyl-ACP methyl ester carboxylesterase